MKGGLSYSPFLVSIRWQQLNQMATTEFNGDDWTHFVCHPIVVIKFICDRIHFGRHPMKSTRASEFMWHLMKTFRFVFFFLPIIFFFLWSLSFCPPYFACFVASFVPNPFVFFPFFFGMSLPFILFSFIPLLFFYYSSIISPPPTLLYFFLPFLSISHCVFFPFFVCSHPLPFFFVLLCLFSLCLVWPIFSPCSYFLISFFFPFFPLSLCFYCDPWLSPMPFWVIEKNSVAITQWGCIWRQLTKFNHHSKYLHHRMVTEEFWSPFNKPTPLDGNRNSLIAQKGKWPHLSIPIQRCGYVKWWLNFFNCQKGGSADNIIFLKKSTLAPNFWSS